MPQKTYAIYPTAFSDSYRANCYRPTEVALARRLLKFWSGLRDSNPHVYLGRVVPKPFGQTRTRSE